MLSVNPNSIENNNDLIRLWAHECERVFRDRLINENDMELFNQMLSKQTETSFLINYVDDILQGDKNKNLIYAFSQENYQEVFYIYLY